MCVVLLNFAAILLLLAKPESIIVQPSFLVRNDLKIPTP